jgi:hypothetical protein
MQDVVAALCPHMCAHFCRNRQGPKRCGGRPESDAVPGPNRRTDNQTDEKHTAIPASITRSRLRRIGDPAPKSMGWPIIAKIDAYLSFIRHTLDSFPTLTASRLYLRSGKTEID